MVLSRMVEIRIGHWRVEHRQDQHLTALENVFSALDGKGQVSKQYYSQIFGLIDALPRGAECVGQTEYFAFRGYLNGTLHLTFLRRDLLARFNQIAGGRRLRPQQKANMPARAVPIAGRFEMSQPFPMSRHHPGPSAPAPAVASELERYLDSLPESDEPETEAEREATKEGRADIAGRSVPHEQVIAALPELPK